MVCNHDLAEMETACADGMCPLCSSAENVLLREVEKAARDVIDDKHLTAFGPTIPITMALDKALSALDAHRKTTTGQARGRG